MKFSVVIPVYRTEHLLARCLDSFAAQTDGDFEVIVVDDASPNEESKSKNGMACSEIVARYDARFKCVRHERNLSLFQARQTGLRMAEGEYVIPFDSDDYALPRLLEEIGKAMGEDARPAFAEATAGRRETREAVAKPPFPLGRAALCRGRGRDGARPSRGFATASRDKNGDARRETKGCQPDVVVYQMMYDDGRKLAKPSVRYRDEILTGAEALDRFFASRIQCAICGKAVRREVYLKSMDQLAAPRDFYLNSSEDLCQTLPVLLNAQSVATISYPGYRYWLNGDSLTTTLTDPARLGRAAENTARVFDILTDLVRRTRCAGRDGAGESLISRLEGFMRPTLRWYLGCLRQLPEAEWRACVAELNRHFPPDLVAREAMLLLEESKTYRLGRMLASPLRIFRRA